MIKLITGVPGTGKTKMLIGMVNEAVAATNGNVVCIEKGIKLRFDINYNVRLINTDEYLIDDAQSLFGFLSGIIASNHDVTDIFIDSALKICQNDKAAFETAVNEMHELAEKTNVNIVLTSSIPKGEEPESLKKYIQ